MIRPMRRPLAAALLAAGLFAAPAHAADPEDVVLAIPTLSPVFTTVFIADDLNLWGKEGLKVKHVHMLGVANINAVLSGSADFTMVTAGGMLRAVARGQKLLAIANVIDRPMMEIVLRKDLAPGFDWNQPLEKRAQVLKGHTLGIGGINAIQHIYLRLVAKRAGIDAEKDIRVAPMESTNMLPAFKAKAIDGFVGGLPFTLSAVLDGSATLIVSSLKGDLPELVPFGYNVVVTTPKECQERRSVCEKVGRVIADAVDYLHDHQKESLAILKKRFAKMDNRLVEASFANILKATPRPPVVTKADFENAEKFNVEGGLVKPEDKLKSYDHLYTNAFVH